LIRRLTCLICERNSLSSEGPKYMSSPDLLISGARLLIEGDLARPGGPLDIFISGGVIEAVVPHGAKAFHGHVLDGRDRLAAHGPYQRSPAFS